jgi:hypothetical protein
MRLTSSRQSNYIACQSRDDNSDGGGAHDGKLGVPMCTENAGQRFGLRHIVEDTI